MKVGVIKIAEDDDFASLKRLVDDHTGWDLEYNKHEMQLYTRRLEGDSAHGKTDNSFKQLKVTAVFPDVEADTVYDVLHDPEYRKVWDTHMIEAVDIGNLNPNNDVGYYAMSCPTPMVNRDFVIQRSWLDMGQEKLILNHSVNHVDYPPRKGYVRATSYLTGFIVRTHEAGSWLGYVSWCDPQGNLPPWLVNKVTNIFGPKMIKNLLKASRNYFDWKCHHHPHLKPWIYPEQLSSPRISIQQCYPLPVEISQSIPPSSRDNYSPNNHTDKTDSTKSNTYQNPRTAQSNNLVRDSQKSQGKLVRNEADLAQRNQDASNYNDHYKTNRTSSVLTNGSFGLCSNSSSPDRGSVSTPAATGHSASCPASPVLVEKTKKSRKLGFKISFKRKH